MNILGQFTIHKGVKYSFREEIAFLSVHIPLHFMAILAFSSLLSYHTLPTLHSYICIFMDIAHYSDGLLGKPIYKISRSKIIFTQNSHFTYFVPIKSSIAPRLLGNSPWYDMNSN